MWMFKLLLEKSVERSFPNVEALLKIYLVIMSGNISCERSFSTLKIIKNPYRTSISKKRLNNLANMCMNSDILQEQDYHDVIDTLSCEKSRKADL